MIIDRRSFLGRAAAMPMIFGLGNLFGQETVTNSWDDLALKRMKETRRYGIVLVIPSDLRARKSLGEAFLARIEGPDGRIHELLSEAVFICATKAPDGIKGNRILLDPDGRPVTSDSVTPSVFATNNAFVKSFQPFLHGTRNERLKDHALGIRRRATAEVLDAIRSLDDESIRVRDRASSTLTRNITTIIPLLVYTGIVASTLEARRRAQAVVGVHFRNSSPLSHGPRLPYGTTRLVKAVDPCPPCGRAISIGPARRFLRFLAK